MNLYKYISSEGALRNIVDGKIKFATLDGLNDPTELFPKVYDVELRETLEEKRRIGYNKDDLADLKRQELLLNLLSPEKMVIKAPETIESANATINLAFYNNLRDLREMLNSTVELMTTRCGIFCVSKRNNSLPMWAHYANNGTGFVIEINNLSDAFTGDGTGILNEVKCVQYVDKRSGVSFKSGSYASLFFEKDKDWGYEAEKRIVTNLSSCQEVEVDGDSIFVREIDKKLISRVIFGWKVAPNEVRRISEIVSGINPNVQFAKVGVGNGKIDID